MGKKQDPAETLRNAKEKGAGRDAGIADGKKIFKKLEAVTKKNYKKQLDLWHEFVKQNPGTSPYNLQSLQRYVSAMAWAIDGTEGIKEACVETVRKNWNAFTAAWRRANSDSPEIPCDVARSVTNFIKGPLAEQIGLTTSKRPRRFATKTHLLHFARQLWMTEWFEYKSPATRVDDWLLHLSNTFSSSRIGEYIESSCRPGSGRGLYYRDITFRVFVNESGIAEFAIQLTRDAKNMTATPEKRPQHALYEGAVPMMLCFNPMLPFLARLLVHGAFRDYDSIEKLLSITPPEDEMLQLYWKDELMETPFFKAQSVKESEEKIETANAFTKRHRAWGLRAGYPKPPTGHDFRAEGLYWVDKFYSEATRMVHAGHTDPNTLRRHYMPTNGADGQDTYLGGKGRTIVADLFRGLTVPRNPNLSQCLPAEKQFQLESTAEYLALNQDLAKLEGRTDTKSRRRRTKLYRTRRKLTDAEVVNWQKNQPNNPNESSGYHRAIFSRVSFMMPERYNLSQNLFPINTLRSPIGLSALHAMIALYRQQSEVEFRPGLEPDKCCCLEPSVMEPETDSQASHDWKHVYTCHKRSYTTGSAELCFLCNEWVPDEFAWEDHCHSYMTSVHELPMFCDPLVYGRVLATAGYCPFCLGDAKLPSSSARLKQFLSRSRWLEHIHKHVSRLNIEKPISCPHPQHWSTTLFETVHQLQFHLQDAHGVPFMRERGELKRKRDEIEDGIPAKTYAKRTSTDDLQADIRYAFINSTMDEARDSRKSSSTPSPSGSYPIHHLDTGVSLDCKSLISSQVGEHIIDPAILKIASGEGACDTEFCDLKSYDPGALASVPMATQLMSLSSPDHVYGSTAIAAEIDRKDMSEDHQEAEERYAPSSEKELKYERPSPVDSDDGQFEVETLIEKRRVRRVIQYLVKWRGYPHTENSWVRKKDIHPGMVTAFEAGRFAEQHQA